MIFGKLLRRGAAADLSKNLPQHLAIIMDGNGRWAKRRGLPRSAGHAAGAETFKKILNICGEVGIPYLTVYAFSTENWNRSKDEVEALMKLLGDYLDMAKDELAGKNVRVKVIGEMDMLDSRLIEKIEQLEDFTKANDGLHLNIAISYGGRQEIINAVKRIASLAKDGAIDVQKIDEKLVSDYLYTAGQPDPDLIIRPSGEYRISNFMLWQAAYSEMWFSHVLWPDFDKRHLLEAIHSYSERSRRFGK